jgi:hypothetical protein
MRYKFNFIIFKTKEYFVFSVSEKTAPLQNHGWSASTRYHRYYHPCKKESNAPQPPYMSTPTIPFATTELAICTIHCNSSLCCCCWLICLTCCRCTKNWLWSCCSGFRHLMLLLQHVALQHRIWLLWNNKEFRKTINSSKLVRTGYFLKMRSTEQDETAQLRYEAVS